MMPSAPAPLPDSRRLFTLDPAVSHLNHGSFGAVPRPVQEAQDRLRAEVESNPVRFYGGGDLDGRIEAARRRLARFAGLDPDGTALIANATTGAAIALDSIALAPGDEILRTDHSYGAVTLAMDRRAGETGAVVREVPLPLVPTDEVVVASILEAVTKRTRLVVLDSVTSATARVFPVAAVHAALRERGIPLFVDAAHGPGLGGLPATGDFWVGNLHKWAYGPRPTALFAVSPEWRGRVRSPVVSWREPLGFPASVEFSGVVDHTPALAAPAGAELLESLGVATVARHNRELVEFGQAVVADALGADVDALRHPGGSIELPMRVIPLPDGIATTRLDADVLRQRIGTGLRTEVAVNPFRDRGLLRLSAQIYNRADEYERLAERLPAFLRNLSS